MSAEPCRGRCPLGECGGWADNHGPCGGCCVCLGGCQQAAEEDHVAALQATASALAAVTAVPEVRTISHVLPISREVLDDYAPNPHRLGSPGNPRPHGDGSRRVDILVTVEDEDGQPYDEVIHSYQG